MAPEGAERRGGSGGATRIGITILPGCFAVSFPAFAFVTDLRTTDLAITAALIGALALTFVVFATAFDCLTAAFGADATRLVTFFAATFFFRTGLTFNLEAILFVFAVVFLTELFFSDLAGFNAAVFVFAVV